MNSTKKIIIIDDDLTICKALTCLFQSVKFNVDAYNSAHAFLAKYTSKMTGCLIIDVRMPLMSGLELLEHLNGLKNRLPIIMISGHADIHMAIRAMKAGAVDFILKPFNDQSLLETVQKYMHPSLCDSLTDKTNTVDQINERLERLSARERQVIHLISDGKLNKEIAYALSISVSTVEVHRANLMRKMQAKNLAQLIKFHMKSQWSMELS